MSCYDHNEEVAQCMLAILDSTRVSADESEENKVVRVAYESLYSCWIEGCLPPALLSLPPAVEALLLNDSSAASSDLTVE